MIKSGKILAAVLVLAMVVMLIPIASEAADKGKVSLYVGKTVILNGSEKLKWKTSNKKVAAVSQEGVVRAKKAGRAIITAKKGNKSLRWTVMVKNPYLNHKEVTLAKGRLIKLKLTGASIRKCTSGNTAVAAITNKDRIKAVGVGKTVISVKASNKKVYKCNVTVTGVARANTTPQASATTPPAETCLSLTGGDHVWDYNHPVKYVYKPRENSVKFEYGDHITGHDVWGIIKCKYCEATKEDLSFSNAHCEYSDDYVVVKEPTCTEDGKRYKKCTLCGKLETVPRMETWKWWEERTTIPHLGHDFEYTYKREISVHSGWGDRRYPEASRNAIESPFGERTATCKRCHESFEEVGIDTGTELNDGTREIVWGVWHQDKNPEIVKEINAYRTGQAGINREPLKESEVLNKAAVYILAEKMQMWTKYGTPASIREIAEKNRGRIREMVSSNFLETKNCYDFEYVNTAYDISKFTECDLMHTAFRFNTEIQYAGVAYFDIECDDSSFQTGVLAVGKQDENLEYVCNHECSGSGEFGATSYYAPGEIDDIFTMPCKKCEFDFVSDPDDYYDWESSGNINW